MLGSGNQSINSNDQPSIESSEPSENNINTNDNPSDSSNLDDDIPF